MLVVNCTNHDVMIDLGDSILAVQPSGNVARVLLEQELVEPYYTIPIYKALTPKLVKGMPEIDDDKLYVVSSTVAQTLKLPNVVCPNHAPAQCTRDYHGKIVSVKSFLRYT